MNIDDLLKSEHPVGEDEIDFRFTILCPHTGFRHFKEGISKLKQVTGREHRDIQRYIVPVIAGAVTARFVIAIRSLMDFRYLSQAPKISESICSQIDASLKEFHDHKQSILDARARVGKGNSPIQNWYIPKLEFMRSVTANIRANGAPIQWSADRAENAHITEIKEPARASNNQNYETQICRYLDRLDKIRRFDLATSMADAKVDFRLPDDVDIDSDGEYEDRDQLHCISSTTALLARIEPVSSLAGPTRILCNYFLEAERLLSGEESRAPIPYRTFAGVNTAFHLTRDPSFKSLAIDEIASKYGIPDLRPALADYLQRIKYGTKVFSVGGRRTASGACDLPFDLLQVWKKVRIQVKEYHEPYNILPPTTINASPPSDPIGWSFGRCDPVIVNTDPTAAERISR